MARKLSQTEIDAGEFGVAVRCGGWRLGLLVARNVAPAKPGRPRADNHSPENEKVSMSKFAELAGCSPSQVKYHYDAWEFAAQAGLVPSCDKIELGDDEVCIDVDAIEDEENERTHWAFFYKMAKNPPEKPSATKEKKEKPKVSEETTETQIDEDFGVSDKTSVTKEQVAEVDSTIARNTLLEILESIQSVSSRLARVDGTMSDENASLLGQISSAAMDLSTMAISLSALKNDDKVDA